MFAVCMHFLVFPTFYQDLWMSGVMELEVLVLHAQDTMERINSLSVFKVNLH